MKSLLHILVENLYLLIAGVIGFTSAVLSEPFRHWIWGPKLKVEFIKSGKGFVTDTRLNGIEDAHYVRVKVLNKGRQIAKQCRAYLVNVEKWNNATNKFESTDYCDSLQLACSAQENPEEPYAAYRALDMPKGVPQFIDIVMTIKSHSNYIIKTRMLLNRYKPLFQEHGKFQYTVLVSGDNAKPKSKKVIFNWSGDWDNFEVSAGK